MTAKPEVMFRFICLPALEMPFPGVKTPKFRENEENTSKHGHSGDCPALSASIPVAQTLKHSEKNLLRKLYRKLVLASHMMYQVQRLLTNRNTDMQSISCLRLCDVLLKECITQGASFWNDGTAHELSRMAGFTGEHRLTEMRNYLK